MVHKTGLNVLYANGAVKFLQRGIVEAHIKESLLGSRHSFASISASKRWPSSWLSTCCLICEGVCKLVQFNSLAPGEEIQKTIAEQKRVADKLKDLE